MARRTADLRKPRVWAAGNGICISTRVVALPAACQSGGRLSVYSDGSACGATLMLEMQVQVSGCGQEQDTDCPVTIPGLHQFRTRGRHEQNRLAFRGGSR
jgi:hypothetical protein